jgi:hypothetical protein
MASKNIKTIISIGCITHPIALDDVLISALIRKQLHRHAHAFRYHQINIEKLTQRSADASALVSLATADA